MSIKYRLFLALLGATGVVVLGMFLLLQWSIDRGFLRYVNTVEQERLENLAGELERAYAEQGSWEFLRENPWRWLRDNAARGGELAREPRPQADRSAPGPAGDRRSSSRLGRLSLLDADREPVFGPPRRVEEGQQRILRVDGQIVGYLGLQKRNKLTEFNDLRFVEQQKLAMAISALVIFVVSAALSLLLAGRLLRPVRALAAATNRLAAGQYGSRVPVESKDELGALARDFNALALTLERNEKARREWLADISHELRTPLAILRGEIEALEDGIRQPTPEAIGSLHAEVTHLGRLVDDLQQLALSDLGALTYRKEEMDLCELLAELAGAYRPEMERKGIEFSSSRPRRTISIFADRERLRQLFVNLLDNSLKYTDPGGRVEMHVEPGKGNVTVSLLDSAPGVPESELNRLFERFYRVETSRNRSTGGAGLGLAICRNIAEAHHGSLQARPSPLGGLHLQVRFPLAEVRS